MRSELNKLFNESVNLAESFLIKHGEFYPFAIAVSPNYEIVHVQGWTGDAKPESDEVIAVLRRGLRSGVSDRSYVSTAVVRDVKLHDRETGECRDAIRVDIEDRDSAPITCYVPYRIEDGGVVTSEVIRVAGEAIVFARR